MANSVSSQKERNPKLQNTENKLKVSRILQSLNQQLSHIRLSQKVLSHDDIVLDSFRLYFSFVPAFNRLQLVASVVLCDELKKNLKEVYLEVSRDLRWRIGVYLHKYANVLLERDEID